MRVKIGSGSAALVGEVRAWVLGFFYGRQNPPSGPLRKRRLTDITVSLPRKNYIHRMGFLVYLAALALSSAVSDSLT